jgi:transposase
MKTNTRTKPRGASNTLPIKVSRRDFNRYIKPHLSVGTRGPETKISTYKIFNHILRVLHTGMQWYQLETGQDRIHWSNIYRHHNRWSKDGSYEKLFASSVTWLADSELLDLFALHGDGSNTVAKKGATGLTTPATNIKKARNH